MSPSETRLPIPTPTGSKVLGLEFHPGVDPRFSFSCRVRGGRGHGGGGGGD